MDAALALLTSESLASLLRQSSHKDDATAQAAIHPVQIQHRIDIARRLFGSQQGEHGGAALEIGGAQVLEVGCGQGDMTLVLAALVGEGGHVDAIDPARLDYGSPLTLGQAQTILKKSSLGDRMTFHQADAPGFLASPPSGPSATVYKAAVLAQCLLYFPSEAAALQTFTALRKSGRVEHLCLAEYAQHASTPSSVPHLLSMLTQAFLPGEEANVRTLFSPAQLTRLAARAGWKLRFEDVLVTPGIQDGRWEVDTVFGMEEDHRAELDKEAAAAAAAEEEGQEEAGRRRRRDLTTFSTLCDAIRAHLPTPGSTKGVTCSDVWVAVFDAA